MNELEFFAQVYPASAPLTVLDVGAHVGNSVAGFLSLFPQAKVHAFEPAPENFRRLQQRFAADPRVTLHAAAVGAADGTARLHLNNYDATHSVLPVDPEVINRWADTADITEVEAITVEQNCIDGLMARAGLATVDILKMDVQGGELLALKGARAALTAQRIGCIFSEVEFRPLYAGQPLAWDIHAELAGLGYQFVNFIGPKVTDTGLLSWADAVYVNRAVWDRLAARHAASVRLAARGPRP